MERTPPPPLVCPVTLDVMDDAVIDHDGYSYDRAAIEEVLRDNPTSPMTRRPMTPANLIPNRALRDMIAAWHKEQPLAIDPDRLTLDTPRVVIGRGAFGEASVPFACNCSCREHCARADSVNSLLTCSLSAPCPVLGGFRGVCYGKHHEAHHQHRRTN